MKKCAKCKELLPKNKFYSDKSKKSGLSSYCISCSKKGSKLRRKGKEEERRNYDLNYRYGIGVKEYSILLEKQENVCKICKCSCKSGMRLSVDHCHSTEKVRGLLCSKCNRALGGFNDDISLLKKAIEYVKNKGDIK